MNIKQAAELIAHRRSIKPIDMDPTIEVSSELWDALFESANWAPSHGHTEPWKFIVYRGDGRSEVAKALQLAYKTDTLPAEFRPEKHEKMGKNPHYAHATVAIVMKPGDNPKILEVEEIEAVACAVQNLHLAASAAGLGVFWSSPAACYGETFATALNLSDTEKCLGVLYIGFPKEGRDWPVSSRRPAEHKVSWVG